MRKQISILLVLVFSISVIGCGSVNAKNDNVNANMTDAVTNNDAQADTEKASEVSVPETKTDFKLFSKGYSGSVYTLPVGSKDEAWTEAQLDAYLADCKAFHENCVVNQKDNIEVDVDGMMKDFGFEYVGTNDEGYGYAENIYWMQRGELKIVVTFTEKAHVYLLLQNSSSSVYTLLAGVGSSSNDRDRVMFYSKYLRDGDYLTKTKELHLKGIAASIRYIIDSDNIDCGRMPYPATYRMVYAINGQSFDLTKSHNYMSKDVELDSVRVYE